MKKKKLSYSSLAEHKDYLMYRRNQVYIVINDGPVKQVLVSNPLGLNWIEVSIFSWFLKRLLLALVQLSASKTLFPVKPSSLFITLLYSLTSIATALQNRPALIITSLNCDAAPDELLQLLSWYKFELKRKVDLSILMYKAFNNETSEYMR